MNELCEECEPFSGGCKRCDYTGLAHELRYHPQDKDKYSVEDIEDGITSHKVVGHLAGKEGKAGVGDIDPRADAREIMNDTPRGRRMQTDVEIPTTFVPGKGMVYEPTFSGTPMAGAGRKMVNPEAEIFRRGNPMKIAWRLLKDGDR
tara:strand:- start:88 stop:528 length:441 start_codon:yes stop_codon:yes gene_type:complete